MEFHRRNFIKDLWKRNILIRNNIKNHKEWLLINYFYNIKNVRYLLEIK